MKIQHWEKVPLDSEKTFFRRIHKPLSIKQIDDLKQAESIEDDVQLSSAHHYEEVPVAPPQEEKPKSRKGLLGIIALVALAVVKFKSLILILLTKGKALLIFLNLGKFIGMASTMIVTVFVYAMFFGWPFAVGFVLLLLVHELGHAFVIKKKGLKAGAPLFIPLMGAVIMMKDQPVDAETEAEIAYGGPAAGVLVSLILYFLAGEYNSEFLMALAYVGFFMNLFNLAPVSPLDGGRIVSAISTKLWIVGLVILLWMFIQTYNIILLLVIVMGAYRLYELWKQKDNLPEDYYNVTPQYRMNMSIAYFGLLAFAGYMTMECLEHLPRATGAI